MIPIRECDICDQNASDLDERSQCPELFEVKICDICKVSVHTVCYYYGGVYHQDLLNVVKRDNSVSKLASWTCMACSLPPVKDKMEIIRNKNCILCTVPHDENHPHALHPITIPPCEGEEITKIAWVHTICGLAIQYHPFTRHVVYGENNMSESLCNFWYNQHLSTLPLNLKAGRFRLHHFGITSKVEPPWSERRSKVSYPNMKCAFCQSSNIPQHSLTLDKDYTMCLPCYRADEKDYNESSSLAYQGFHVGCALWRQRHADTLSLSGIKLNLPSLVSTTSEMPFLTPTIEYVTISKSHFSLAHTVKELHEGLKDDKHQNVSGSSKSSFTDSCSMAILNSKKLITNFSDEFHKDGSKNILTDNPLQSRRHPALSQLDSKRSSDHDVDEISDELVKDSLEPIENQSSDGEADNGILFPSDILCDICERWDGYRGHNMQRCKTCRVAVHESCYGRAKTVRKFQNWECMACQSTSWEESCRERKRPTECVLCSISKGVHAMHPVYDTDGHNGKPLWLRQTKTKPKRRAWVHTLCAFFVGSNSLTGGTIYQCDKNGNYESSSEEEDDGSSLSINGSQDGFDIGATHHFVFSTGKEWATVIKESRDLKCYICGKVDSKQQTLGIPVQCGAGDSVELDQFKQFHEGEAPCVQAMHVGCARWSEFGKSVVRENRLFYYPGDEDEPEPVQACFCDKHAEQIHQGRAKTKRSKQPSIRAKTAETEKYKNVNAIVGLEEMSKRKGVAQKGSSALTTTKLTSNKARIRLQSRKQSGRRQRDYVPTKASLKNVLVASSTGGKVPPPLEATALSRRVSQGSMREKILKVIDSVQTAKTSTATETKASCSFPIESHPIVTNMTVTKETSQLASISRSEDLASGQRDGSKRKLVTDQLRREYVKNRKVLPDGRARDHFDLRLENEILNDDRLKSLPQFEDNWTGVNQVEKACIHCCTSDHEVAGFLAPGMQAQFLAICLLNGDSPPIKELALAILERTNEKFNMFTDNAIQSTLLSFLELGGLILLKDWLDEASELLFPPSPNNKSLFIILHLLEKMPFDQVLLKIGRESGIIKSLKKLKKKLNSLLDREHQNEVDRRFYSNAAEKLERLEATWTHKGKLQRQTAIDDTFSDLHSELLEKYRTICDFSDIGEQAPWLAEE